MHLLLFHNVFSTGNPVADSIFVVLILVLFIGSHLAILKGAIYLIRFWRNFSSEWKMVLIAVPIVISLGVPFLPVHLAWPAVPFGLFAGFPSLFFLDTRELLVYNLAGIAGTILNIVGFIGVGGYFEKKFGDN